MATGGTFFEELGFYYVGPVDAHDLDNLIPIIENIRDNVPNTKPVLLHVKSVKGKGTPPPPLLLSPLVLLLLHSDSVLTRPALTSVVFLYFFAFVK